jgi:ribonuclease HII
VERVDPATDLEREHWSNGLLLVAGVDEVGRGCLAGPVVAAACVLPPGLDALPGVRDSKQLTSGQRQELLPVIFETALSIGVGAASRAEIDRLNVRRASVLAMQRALTRLGDWHHALLDGPLGSEFEPERHTGVIDGDATCLSIACASIVAKVTRDRLMVRLARRHPEFGWERNAGYGTAEHLAALRALGPTPHHRRTFRPVQDVIDLRTTRLDGLAAAGAA